MKEKIEQKSPKIRASRGIGGGLLDKNNTPRSKKITLTILTILLVICIVVGISYAYWLVRVNQESSNIIKSGCLNITLSDKSDAINLEDAYPISDEVAESLTPYEFTIANTCSSSVDYDVTLEIMGTDDRLSSEYVAINFNDTGKKLLSSYISVNPTYSEDGETAVEARKLTIGTLEGNTEITYTIKLWIDQDVTSLDSMDKIFTSKINVTAIQEQEKVALIDYITTLSETDKTNLVADDETDDHNIRYIGADPDNYLCFDLSCSSGKWRVIGVMNNMETSDGETKSLVKIVRAESIGEYAWDDSNIKGISSTNPPGINDWSTASLNTYLNGEWYTTNLNNYDNLIENVVWNLGGYSADDITTSEFYAYERGTLVYEGRPTEWTGKVALIYPSDYGFATSGGDTGRDTCLNLTFWRSYSDCYNNDYLYDTSYWEWTLMPYTSYSYTSYIIAGYGPFGSPMGGPVWTSELQTVHPTFYMKSEIMIFRGTGTSTDPWIIGA